MALKFGEGYVPIYLTGMGGFTTGLARARAVFQQSLTGMEAVARRARIGLLLGAAIGAGVVKAAASFEQGMARVQALTNATGEEFDSLRTQALLLGRTTVYSARQASDAMGYFALAGFSTDKIMRAMPATLNLAAAGQMDVAQAADIAAKLMAGMGVEAKDLDHAVDVMAKAFTTSNTDLVQLGSAFKYVGPVAKSAGVSLEEITATLMAVSNAGIQASMAGTTMRGVLARLASQPNELKKVFAELGVTITTTGGRLRPLADIFDDLNRAMEGIGEADRMGKMITAFGLRAGPGLLELLSVGGDAIRQMQASLEDAGGTAERIAKIQLDTLQGSWVMLKSAAEGLAIELGDQLIPHMRSLADHLKTVATYFANLSDEEQRSIVATAAMTMRLLSLLTVMPMVATAIGGLILTGLAFGGAPVGIIVALTAAVSALGLAYVEGRIRGEEMSTMIEHYLAHLAGIESSLDRQIEKQKSINSFEEARKATLAEIAKLEEKLGIRHPEAEAESAKKKAEKLPPPLAAAEEEVDKATAEYIRARNEAERLRGELFQFPKYAEATPKEQTRMREQWAASQKQFLPGTAIDIAKAEVRARVDMETALKRTGTAGRKREKVTALYKRAEIEEFFGAAETPVKTAAMYLDEWAEEFFSARQGVGIVGGTLASFVADAEKGMSQWDRVARITAQGAGPAAPWLAAPTFQEAQVDRLEKQLESLEKEKAEASKQRPGMEFTSPLEFWKQMQQRISAEQLDKRRNELLDNIDKNIDKTKTAIEKLKGGVAAGA